MKDGRLAFSLDDVGDPSDWTGESAVLRSLDSSLRCDLCFDIFNAPVTFKACSHTFCSTCIRTHINQPGAAGAFCPKCRQGKAYDSELVPLVHLEGTAECWRKVRPFIMDMWDRLQRAEEQGAQHRSQGTQAESSETGKRKAEQPNSTPESSVRRSKRVRAQGTSAETAFVLSDDNVDDDDYRPLGEREAEEKKLEADDTVACPICNHTFTVIALNAHLDKNNCHPGCPEPSAAERGLAKAKPTNTSQWFNKPTALGTGTSTPTKKLTRPQYNLKSERDLKKLLEGLQLPTTGDKDKLAERHRQYVNLYNANLDAAPQHRKSEAKLRRELVEWERARDARGGSISDKKAKSWLADNKDQYADLIAKARETAMRDREKRNKKPSPPASADAQDVEAVPPNGATSSSPVS